MVIEFFDGNQKIAINPEAVQGQLGWMIIRSKLKLLSPSWKKVASL